MTDLLFILQWWLVWLVLGIIFIPLTVRVFPKFVDGGYIFSKIFALILIGYTVFILSMFRIAPFTLPTIITIILIYIFTNGYLLYTDKKLKLTNNSLRFFVFEETLFLIALIFWSYIRGHEPSINGLEKFMDFGFVNSILRSEYFPPHDMWYSSGTINYYYFGHYLTALLTKLSFLPSPITYNLMLASLFACVFTQCFSLCMNIVHVLSKSIRNSIIAGFLGALLTSLAGNLHTIYAFFSSYSGEKPVPFWVLKFQPFDLFMNGYWYPNATRFIPYTIHEFPLYSFVVADLHGHVLDIPFVLFTVAYLLSRLTERSIPFIHLIFISFLLSIMYMTNAWDSAIYLLLTGLVLLSIQFTNIHRSHKHTSFSQLFISTFVKTFPNIFVVLLGFIIFTLPFNMHFSPPVSGIGIMCSEIFQPLAPLAGKFGPASSLVLPDKIGPFIFEADHCSHSPVYMILILYGFFFFFAGYFIYKIYRSPKLLTHTGNIFVAILILLSLLLILIPEIIYVKDIYPQHYRANTMFKLVYQAFVMLSITSAVVIVQYIKPTKNYFLYIVSIFLIALVLLYPRFAVFSYYGDLKSYRGLDGIAYMKDRLTDDHKAIEWINREIKGQPIIVEAQGDSYTDYGRISANTGLPTVLGWTVHEWLWRGSYDVPAPRIEDVRKIYESESLEETKSLLQKYNVSYVYVGNLEREKYPNIQAEKFRSIAQPVYQNQNVILYKL